MKLLRGRKNVQPILGIRFSKAERVEISAAAKGPGAPDLILQEFLHFRGMSTAQFHCLLQCGCGNDGVYMYCPFSKTVWAPSSGEIPWTVEFVLRTHTKHVYIGRTSPSLDSISSALLQWETKIRWLHLFGKLPVSSQWQTDSAWMVETS